MPACSAQNKGCTTCGHTEQGGEHSTPPSTLLTCKQSWICPGPTVLIPVVPNTSLGIDRVTQSYPSAKVGFKPGACLQGGCCGSAPSVLGCRAGLGHSSALSTPSMDSEPHPLRAAISQPTAGGVHAQAELAAAPSPHVSCQDGDSGHCVCWKGKCCPQPGPGTSSQAPWAPGGLWGPHGTGAAGSTRAWEGSRGGEESTAPWC